MPEPDPGEKKNMDRTEENKTIEDRRDLGEITDKEDKFDLDSDSVYLF